MDLVQLLVEYSADVMAQDKDKSTPLHLALASWLGSVGLVRFLLEHGANAMARNKHGWTPLHMVLRKPQGHVDLAQLLIKPRCQCNSSGQSQVDPTA